MIDCENIGREIGLSKRVVQVGFYEQKQKSNCNEEDRCGYRSVLFNSSVRYDFVWFFPFVFISLFSFRFDIFVSEIDF